MSRPKCQCGGPTVRRPVGPGVYNIFCERCGCRAAYAGTAGGGAVEVVVLLSTFRATAEATRQGTVRWLPGGPTP